MKSRIARGQSPRGFTLLEVVVAMAIVGLGVTTLFEIFSSGLRLGARSFERTEAAAYSRQAMDEALIRRNLKDGVEDGSVGHGHRWRLRVRAAGSESGLDPSPWELKEITLEMSYRSEGREKPVEIRSLRLVKKGS